VIDGFIRAALCHQLDRPRLASSLEYAEAMLPIDDETEALRRALVGAVADALKAHGIADPDTAARDLVAMTHGMIDAAGLFGETDIGPLEQRVRHAVYGYLDLGNPARQYAAARRSAATDLPHPMGKGKSGQFLRRGGWTGSVLFVDQRFAVLFFFEKDRIRAGRRQAHFVALHFSHQAARQIVVVPAMSAVACLGQLDAIPFDRLDRAKVCAIGADDFHVLFYQIKIAHFFLSIGSGIAHGKCDSSSAQSATQIAAHDPHVTLVYPEERVKYIANYRNCADACMNGQIGQHSADCHA